MSALPLRPIAFGDELTLVDHLSELRTRLIVCAAAMVILFAGCLWQSRALLTVLDRPLASLNTAPPGQASLQAALDRSGRAFSALSHSPALSAPDRRAVVAAATSLEVATRDLGERKPITIGLGEPFSTSVMVAFAFALVLGSPLLLWQLWA